MFGSQALAQTITHHSVISLSRSDKPWMNGRGQSFPKSHFLKDTKQVGIKARVNELFNIFKSTNEGFFE